MYVLNTKGFRKHLLLFMYLSASLSNKIFFDSELLYIPPWEFKVLTQTRIFDVKKFSSTTQLNFPIVIKRSNTFRTRCTYVQFYVASPRFVSVHIKLIFSITHIIQLKSENRKINKNINFCHICSIYCIISAFKFNLI